ncbi:MAG: hypothetical protein N2439_01150, partial [Anaerolineae bacterium]|nr:hypothetical protein [Anaerolineae bacterium]
QRQMCIRDSDGIVDKSYATGSVTGSDYVGGLVGVVWIFGMVTASFWDTQTTGQTTSAGGTGKTTAEMKQLATFAGWDIDDAGGTGAVWRIYDGQTYPLLRGFLAPLTLTPAFNGSGSYSNIAAYAETGVDAGKLLAGNATLKIASTSGGVAAQLSGYASTQQGYDIAYASHPLAGLGSGGNLRLDSPISWNSGTLRLVADGNIEILSTLDASGGGKVALEYGQGATDGVIGGKEASYSFGLTGAGFTGRINLQAGNNFTTKLGSDGTPIQWTVITSLGSAGDETSGPTNSLQGLAHSSRLSGHYVLGADIDASATSTWNSGAGFAPIGNTMGFTGRFDGLGHVITNLTINRPTTDYVGLFGHASGGVRNVGLDNGSVSGKNFVGGLVGRNYSGGTISNSYATGSVNGGSYLGGLVGNNYGGTISNSYATGGVTGSGNDAGGLVGNNYGGT